MLLKVWNSWRSAICAATIVCSLVAPHALAQVPRDFAVEVTAAVQTAPPQVRLVWPADANATGYTISRKAPPATAWTSLTSLAGSATGYTDESVAYGASYEYQIVKSSSLGITAYGYIVAGIDAPVVESRGKLILVVDNTHASELASELALLQQDITGDGWTVIRHDVSPTATVASVKSLIQSDYNSDRANVKSVLLFGHVPVPRSGDINPDGHPNHIGAWAADTYYGDMDGVWTDSSVNDTSAERSDNWNTPGDGKFDQSQIPSDLELAVGRVDLSNMTCFSNKTPSRSEVDLLRAYLNKDHNFRTGSVVVPRRGLVADNFGYIYGEAYASTGFRSFAPMFGATNTTELAWGAYFPTLSTQPYLFSYACGGGSYYTCAGVGGSDDFALNEVQAVFTMHFGSYFGDWDNESNFLRASLGSGYVLTTTWSGRPIYFYHHMGLGETVGYSVRLSQNNGSGGTYQPQYYGSRDVNSVLMGDPTLRLHPVLPPSNLTGGISGSSLVLSWTGSSDIAIKGYNVYRAATAAGPFTRLNSTLLGATTFADAAPIANGVYMVRAVKLEFTPSGTYYNPSQGVFFTSAAVIQSPTPLVPSGLVATPLNSSQVKLSWIDNSFDETAFQIWRKSGTGTYAAVATVNAGVTTFTNTSLSAGPQYFYKICAVNSSGASAFTPEIITSTGPYPPTQITASAISSTQLRVTWADNSSNETGFRVFRREAGKTYAAIAEVGSNLTEVVDATALPGVRYYYTLSALGSPFQSGASVEATAVLPGPPASPSNLAVSALNASQVKLSWVDNSTDESGFKILRKTDATASYVEIATVVAGVTTFTNSSLAPGPTYTYRVCAFNSNGSSAYSPDVTVTTAPYPPTNLAASALSSGQIQISWTDNSTNETGFRIFRAEAGATYSAIGVVSSNVTAWIDTTTSAGIRYYYTVSAIGSPFQSGATNAVTIVGPRPVSATQPSTAQFVGFDSSSQGNWQGKYGKSGFWIDAASAALTPAVAVTASDAAEWVWDYGTASPSALARVDDSSNRIAACWYSASGFRFDIRANDGQSHQISIYFLDWDTAGRQQQIEVTDASTGVLLDTQNIKNFGNGTYVTWTVSGHIQIKVTAVAGPNCTASGIFID